MISTTAFDVGDFRYKCFVARFQDKTMYTGKVGHAM